MFNDLNELLMIPSVRGDAEPNAPFGKDARRALDWFLEKAKSFGLRCGDMDGYCGWAEYGDPSMECIGVLGHLDVVPSGEGWPFEPYKLTIKDGYLYGRGVVDDKGPTLAALYGLKNIKDAALKLKRRIRVIVGCDEESGSACMKHYSQHGDIPVMSITPDADFPIINSEKGILRVKITLNKDQFMLDNDIKIVGGTTINVVPPLGTLTAPLSSNFAKILLAGGADNLLDAPKIAEGLKNQGLTKKDFTVSRTDTLLKVEAHGVAGHAMAPHKADNALWKIFKFLNIFSSEFNSPILNSIYSNFCNETSAKILDIADFDEESGDLTLSMDIIEDAPKTISLSLDIRYPRTSNQDTIINKISGKMPKGAKVDYLNGEPPLYIPKSSAMVQALLKVYSECTGLAAYTKHCGGGTYARRLPNAIAFGPTFPDAQTNIHNICECISIEQFEMLPKIYERAMIELANL